MSGLLYQRIRQYENVIDGSNGLLADTSNDWYEAIKSLIEDKDLRKKMGENAYKTIHDEYQIKNNVDQYAEFFIYIFDKQSKKD